MTAIIGLMGALVGAFIAFAGQVVAIRAARQGQWASKLHERCAQIYTLERECDLAAWEILHGRYVDRLDRWDYLARRKAEGEVLLLTHDPGLASALGNLTVTGMRLSVTAHDFLTQTANETQLRKRRQEHAATIAEFCEVARDELNLHKQIAPRRFFISRRRKIMSREFSWPVGPAGAGIQAPSGKNAGHDG